MNGPTEANSNINNYIGNDNGPDSTSPPSSPVKLSAEQHATETNKSSSMGELPFLAIDDMVEFYKSSWALDAYSYTLPEPGSSSIPPASHFGRGTLARLLVNGLSLQLPARYDGDLHNRTPLARNDGDGNVFGAYNFNLFDIIQEAEEIIAETERMEVEAL